MLLVDKKVYVFTSVCVFDGNLYHRYVGLFQPKKERSSEESKLKYTNIYVKNLDPSYTNEQLSQKFSEFGKITSAVIMTNEKGESKGFGFVNYEKPEDAHAAVEALNNSMLEGRTVYVGRAQKKQEREEELRHQRMDQLSKYQGVNVYVKNLDDSIDDDRLRQEFAKFGTITSAKIMRDDKGNSKGFGFVCFSNPEEATRAVTDLNGNLLASKPLYVGLAQRKDVRRSQLEALHNQKLSQLRMAPQGVMPPIYPGGQPVFFQPGMPPQGPRMMYQQMVPRPPRFNGPQGAPPAGGAGPAQGAGRQQGGGFQQGMPNFVVPMGGAGGQRQQQPRGPRGPRGPGGPNGGQPQGVPVNGMFSFFS